MRAAILLALHLTGALAVPHKRAAELVWDTVWNTDTEVAYVTATEYATANAKQREFQSASPQQSTSVEVVTTATVSTDSFHKHHDWHTTTSTYVAPLPTSSSSSKHVTFLPSSVSSSEYVASLPSSSSSSEYIAPDPSPSYSPSSDYVAPATSSSSEYATAISTSSPMIYATTSSATQSSSSPPVPPPGFTQMPASYTSDVIATHNAHRYNHSAANMAYDICLEMAAFVLVQRCDSDFQHDMSFVPNNCNIDSYGQNMGAGLEASDINKTITEQWYNEVVAFEGLYNQATPVWTEFEHWGHFTQVVWNASTAVGCYTAQCTNSTNGWHGLRTICNYQVQGNMLGEFAQNVYPPK